MFRTGCLLFCGILSLFGETIGNANLKPQAIFAVPGPDGFAFTLDSTFTAPQPFTASQAWSGISEQGWNVREYFALSSTQTSTPGLEVPGEDSGNPLEAIINAAIMSTDLLNFQDAGEPHILEDAAQNASLRIPLAILMCVFFLTAFMREHWFGRLYCRDYQELREHMMLAAKDLAMAREHGLLTSAGTGANPTEYEFRHRQAGILNTGIAEHCRVHQCQSRGLYCREYEELREHLAVVSRSLALARQEGLQAVTRAVEKSEECEASRRRIEILEAAIQEHGQAHQCQSRRLYCGEYEELREHMMLAARNLAVAREEGLLAAILAGERSPEYQISKRSVEILRAGVVEHCHVHQCQSPRLPVRQLRAAPIH
jgi:uncharacterized membrane-anchored protein YhcB (DUF1043 family)